LLLGLPLPGGQQFGSEVTGDHARPGPGCGDGGVAGSGGHVEYPVSGPDLAGVGQDLAQAGNDVSGQGG
jgi:hypothetical protein